MKKHFKILLSAMLILALLLSSVTASFAEADNSGELNWIAYNSGKLGTGGAVNSGAKVELATDNVYTGEDGDGDGTAYKLLGNCFAQYVTCKLPVEQGKYYEISFNYFTGKNDGAGGAFSHVIVSKDGAEIKDYNNDYHAEVYRDFAFFKNKNNALVKNDLRTTKNVTTGWNKMTVYFYSGNLNEVVLALRPTVGTDVPTYVDNLKIYEIAEPDGSDDILSDATAVVYNMSGLNSFANTNKFGNTYSFAKNTTNYTAETDADGDGEVYTMSANCHAQWATMQIPVQKNQNYELTFKYHANKVGSNNAMFSHIRVIEYGAVNAYGANGNLASIGRDEKAGYFVNKNKVKVDAKINITEGTTTESWNEIKINFYSRELTYVMLVLRPVIDNQTAVSIDDVNLKTVDSFVGSERYASDFTVYENGTTILGTGGTVRPAGWGQSRWEYVADENLLYKGEGADNDGEGILLDTSAQWAVAKMPVKTNTYYNLTFKYFGEALDGYQWGDDGMFSDVIVLPDGKAKNVASDHLGYLGRNAAYYNNKNGTQIDFTNRINSNVKANEWNEVTIPFYSGNLSEVLLAIRSTVAIVYIDNIKLSAVSTLPSGNLFPNGWTVYKMESVGAEEHTTAVVGDSTEFVHSEGGDGKSVALMPSTYAQYAAMPMATEKNQYYTLEFYYLSDAINTAWGNNYILSHIYVSAGATGNLADTALAAANTDYNGTVKKNGVGISVPGFTTKGVQPNEWVKAKITFYSGDNTQVRFAVRPAVNDKTTVYLDDITLNKVSISTAYNNMAAVREAKDSNIGKNGLRVYNSVQTDWLNEAEGNIVEYGSIAVKEEYLAEAYEDKAAPDMSMIIANDKKLGLGVAYRAEGATTVTGSDAKNIHWEENNTDDIFARKVFTSYLTGISKENYGKNYLIRTYAIDAEGNIFYGDTVSVCIFDVVWAISVANNSENVADNDAFKSFVIDSGVQAEYEAWCTENSRDFGGLYNALTAE